MDEVSALVLAVVDEFLRKNGFAHSVSAIEDTSPSKTAGTRQASSAPVISSPLRAQVAKPTDRIGTTSAQRPQQSAVSQTITSNMGPLQDSSFSSAANKRSGSALNSTDSLEISKRQKHLPVVQGDTRSSENDGCQWLQDLLSVSIILLWLVR